MRSILATTSVLALMLTGLAGCSPTSPHTTTPSVNLAGFPPAFREGYADGCDSAKVFIERRDDKRYAEDRQYAAGWRDGFDICRRK